MEKEVSKEWLKAFENLNESQKRWVAAVKAVELGYGGVSIVGLATNLSRTTITRGLKEIKSKKELLSSRIRNEGGGRSSIAKNNASLIKDLEEILIETTAGDPMSPIRWTCKSTRSIAEKLQTLGHKVSKGTIHSILVDMGYSLQSNRKALSRADNPDRDKQFGVINRRIKKFLSEDLPVISVDTKKKELVGKFFNKGATWRPKDNPYLVEDHDFPNRSEGKAIPYGTYDIGKNEGFVNVGVSSDTADFAVNSIRCWWQEFGERNYPDADRILICADGGGSNGSRNRLWKYNLQRFSDKTGLEVFVSHYPPGTSKWNKIEHRMFSYISSHWRGQPLESYEAIIQLIGSTTTKSGLKIKAKLDRRKYKRGKKISDEEFEALNITANRTFPKWNYSVTPF